MKKALITGITGQDGSYLAEFLMRKGHEVHGIDRRPSRSTEKLIPKFCKRLTNRERQNRHEESINCGNLRAAS